MAFDLLNEFVPGIQRLLRRLFCDKALAMTVTYRLYHGMSPDSAGDMIPTWQEFLLPALPTSLQLSSISVQSGGSIEKANSGFMFRPADFPNNVSVGDLTVNDEVVADGKCFRVRDINRTIPFVVAVSVDGE